jgi:FKBP-type peptidyl-prolyl cis-trans isomerase
MKTGLSIVLFLSGMLCLATACGTKPQPGANQKQPVEFDKEGAKKQFIKANQQLMQKENDEMDYYARSHKMRFVRTGSGIRYYIYKHSEKGDSIRPGMQVTMDFNLKLLDGTECYSSKTDGPKTLVVAEEEAESGIHRGLQYLKRGDKAVLLIPSPLAHGLLGDFKKIPPQMPIIYDVQVY